MPLSQVQTHMMRTQQIAEIRRAHTEGIDGD